MKNIWMLAMFLAMCAYLAGELHVMTGSWAYVAIGLLFIFVVGFLAHLASVSGVATGFESLTRLKLEQVMTYADYHGLAGDVPIYVAQRRLVPAKSVYYALLDGQRALIIEAEEIPHGEVHQ